LTYNQVPFQIVKGLGFFERKENKDVIAYLRLLVNPADNISLLRVVNEPARGIGKVSLDHLQTFADENQLSLFQATGQVAKIPAIKGKAAKALGQFHQLLLELQGKLALPIDKVVQAVLDETGYRKMLRESDNDEDRDRLANVEELVTFAQQVAEEDPERSLGDFLEQITLASDIDNWNDSTNIVSIMTLHASKGLEFPIVYMVALEQGILPGQRSLEAGKNDDLEEERRVCFVGMTRAMKQLNMCYARVRDFRGQRLYAIPSMFLDELPNDTLRLDLGAHGGRIPSFDQYRGGSSSARSAWGDTGIKPSEAAQPPLPRLTTPGAFQVSSVDEIQNLERGQLVQEEQYGIGTVTEVSGLGSLRKIKIQFAVGGLKTFMLNKVKLKVVVRKTT
jgi:DNA helicase-2/ATP-dependent DNA helicase PcrA